MEEKNSKDIKLEISPEVAQGVYSNFVVISHSATEFCVDFAQIFPGNNGPVPVRSRVVMTPFNARTFLNALADNVQKYESKFGRIREPQTARNEGDTIPYEEIPPSKA